MIVVDTKKCLGGKSHSTVYSVFMYYLEDIEKMTKNESIVVLVRGWKLYV